MGDQRVHSMLLPIVLRSGIKAVRVNETGLFSGLFLTHFYFCAGYKCYASGTDVVGGCTRSMIRLLSRKEQARAGEIRVSSFVFSRQADTVCVFSSFSEGG